jgi:hypothetical protein
MTLTLAEGNKIRQELGTFFPSLSLYASSDWLDSFGMPVIWNVIYNAAPGPDSVPKQNKFLLARVNPTTGEIIALEPSQNVATPTPAAP